MHHTIAGIAFGVAILQIISNKGNRDNLKLDHPEIDADKYYSNFFLYLLLIADVVYEVIYLVNGGS